VRVAIAQEKRQQAPRGPSSLFRHSASATLTARSVSSTYSNHTLSGERKFPGGAGGACSRFSCAMATRTGGLSGESRKAAARFTCAQGKSRRTPQRGRLSVDGEHSV